MAQAATCKIRRRDSIMDHLAARLLTTNNGWRDKQIMLFFDQHITVLLSGDQMHLSDRIGRRMKLQDLHVLMTVVEAGSMRKAAALLNTAQPAVSRAIAELEHAVGVRLLDRTSHGVEPTTYGRALLDGGAAMFDDLSQAVRK